MSKTSKSARKSGASGSSTSTSKNKSTGASYKARREFNQAQAEARRERSHGSGPRNIADVYDYAVEQSGAGSSGKGKGRADRIERRAKEGLHGGQGKRRRRDEEEDEDEEISDNSEDNDDEPMVGPTVFDNSDDEQANEIEGSDEEIDSDEAFGDSDNERFEGWKFAGARHKDNNKPSGRRKKRGEATSAASDDSDEEAEEEDEDGDDMIDISRMLDGDSSDDESEEDDQSGDDERLQQHLSSMTNKRAVDDDPNSTTVPSAKRTRRLLSDRTEAMQENDWAATKATGAASTGAHLRVEDLLDALSGQAGFSSVRNSARALSTRQEHGDADRRPVASRKGGGPLAAPLPTVLQDRLDRQAAYSATKDEVEGWAPTIKRLREAEHLSFPLQADPVQRVTNSSLTSSFRPDNAFEREIADILAAEGMTEKQLAAQEELEMKELDPEEVKRRREELRRMRELLFRAEQKSKRVSKIKSKAYRKVARKEKERERAKLEAAGLLNADPEEEQEHAIKAERLRAKERATLKHKNTSKWAKHALGRKEQNSETRGAIEEQLRRGEQLRRKIHGLGSDEDEDELDQSDGDVSGEDTPHARAFDELDALERRDAAQRAEDAANASASGKHKSVMSMKFMKDARDRDARAAQHDADELRRDLANMEAQANGEKDLDELEDTPAGSVQPVQGNEGRALYGTGAITTMQQQIAGAATSVPANQKTTASSEGNSRGDGAVVDTVSVIDTRKKAAAPPRGVEEDVVSNPWLVVDGPTSKLSRKENSVAVGRASHDATRTKNRADKAKSKGEDARNERDEDARVDISTGSTAVAGLAKVSKKNIAPFAPDASSGDDSDGDEPVMMKHRRPEAVRQRALVAEAFAGDDVAAEFAEAKRAIVEEDAPREEDHTLPGWGAWGGRGVKATGAARRRKFIKTIAGLDPTKRKDAKTDHVIINERKDKKAERYKAKDLPYPYTSAAQYELAMRNPVGPEWNTVTQHQRLTLPKVVVKPGKVIKPIERKF